MKTRTKKAAAVPKSGSHLQDSPAPKPSAYSLEPSVVNPPQVFILPKDSSPHARIITLPDPVNASPTRYFVCPDRGFHEFTRITGPKRACRSWLLAPDREALVDADKTPCDDGHILQSPTMFIATPIDPLLLMLPILWSGPDSAAEWGTLHDRLFLSASSADYAQLHTMLKSRHGGKRLQALLGARVNTVCQSVRMSEDEDATYCLHLEKLASMLVAKARRVMQAKLPASLEEVYVKRALEVPELSMRRKESGLSIAPDANSATTEGAEQIELSKKDSFVDTEEPQKASASDVAALMRLRIALDYILAAYVPPSLRTALEASHFINPLVDFAPLTQHLAHIQKLRSEATALRGISDNISRKRSAIDGDDEEAIERAEAKKRKKEAEDLRKKNESRGVKKLGKVDVSGMKKMSSFFTKGPAVKK